MDEFIGSWGLYPWFDEDSDELVHPNDIESFKALKPYGKVFNCISKENDYIVLSYADRQFRVKPELYKVVKSPSYKYNENVIIVGKGEEGKVIEINWHHGKAEEFYSLAIKEKRSSKRYFVSDLEKIVK